MSVDLISVAEQDYNSEEYACYIRSRRPNGGRLRFSITEERDLHIVRYNANNNYVSELEISEIDLAGLIEFLKDANEFVLESDVIKKLKGKNV